MQQASGLGRVILNYANTPMQYARIMKRSTQDLLAGRGEWKTHVSRILYYGAVQNLIFNALQQAIFTLLFDEEEEKDRTVSDKAENIGFGMLSSSVWPPFLQNVCCLLYWVWLTFSLPGFLHSGCDLKTSLWIS